MLFLINTCFELELENPSLSLKELLRSHHNFEQLLFLGVLLAQPEDHVVVTHYPPDEYLLAMEKQGFQLPHFVLLKDVSSTIDVFVWGVTPAIRQLFPTLHTPPEIAVEQLSSKLFAHKLSPLPGSRVLYTKEELDTFPAGIIKTPHGFSGRGNIPVTAKKRLEQVSFPLLGEPLKQRLYDFSTHWEISDGNLHYVGATKGEYTAFGSYIGNRAGDEIPHLEEQKAFVEQKKEILLSTGYFGPFSVDAMVYEENGPCLQPIIEINPRRTMGWLTWALWKKWSCSALEIRYEKNSGQAGLLPTTKNFSKQLTYTIYR